VLHTGVNGGCATCHGGFSALTWANNFTPKDGILGPPAHIPYTAGSDCSSCHAANYVTGGFGPTNMSAAKHAFVPAVCATCHEAGLTFFLGTSSPALQGRPADHVASGDAQQKTGDCSLCHNTTDWTSNTLPIGHMPNPGSQACAVCHTGINGTFASYATITTTMTVMHTGITGNCGQCHGGPSGALTFYNNNDNPKAAVLTPLHIPYLSSADCSSCHVVGQTFGPTQMSAAKHAFVPAACDTCHEAGLTFYMGASTPALQGRPADHMAPTGSVQQQTGDCSGCHTTANWVTTALPAGHMPNPGGQSCAICHTGDLSTQAGYATLASIATLHTGISGNCGQCHGSPSGALTFYNNNDPIKSAVLSPVHIPYLTGADCSSCHASNYVAGGFGPTNMTSAKHAFVPTTCDTCHDGATTFYLGTSTPQPIQKRPPTHISAPNPATQATADCSACHTTTDWNAPTTLPAGHMPIPGTQTCTVCHTGTLTANPASYATLATIPILHTGITTGCAQCHGGATQLTFYNNNDNPKAAASLSPAHIPSFTNNDCSACHTANYVTGGFGPMNMTQATHTNVSTMTCKTCHEAGLTFYMGAASPALQGRPADHTGSMAAPADCSVCHTTANWNSTTLPSGHMPTPGTQTCNTCHTSAPTNYKVFATNAVLHTGITGNCSQCHGAGTQLSFYNNDMVVKDSVLTPSHIPYIGGTDCSSCHKSTTYAAGSFGPMNMTQATHAFVATTCNTCHGTATVSFFIGAASPTLQLRPADHTSGNQVAPNDCSGCHTTANWNSTSLPTGHMPNPANKACAICHTTAPADYTTATLAANSVLHTGISSNCGQCHGATTALTWYNNYTPKDAILAPAHIPYVAGTDCSSCHKSTTYAAGTFGPMNMTQATHAFVSTTCDTCHGTATASFYIGAASPTLQLRPADHTTGTMLTGDCSGCHTTANWNSNSLPAGHMPNPGNQACLTCHTSSPANYKVFATNAVLHTGITSNCSQCHGAGTQLSFYNNDMVVKDSVLSPAHIPYLSGTDCGSCHKSTTYAAGTFGPMNMTQATHAFVSTTCDTCHASAAGSLYMGAASPTLQRRPADHSSGTMLTGDCSGCHTTANWNSGTLPAGHMPTPGTATCLVCHTAAPANYTTMATNAILHTGITKGCITCHGQTQLSFYNNNDPPKPMVAGHIPSAATPCEDCHSATTFTTFSGTTMSSAKHTLMFAVIGKTCDACHETGKSFTGVTNLTTRPNNHHVGQDCSGCHSPNNWGGNTAKRTVAATTTASRSTIGTVVSGSATAQSTARAGAALIAANSGSTTPGIGTLGTGASTGGTPMSHAGVTGNCVSCHNGVLAQGKGATHIASNNSCSNCHSTVAWLPAHFDHQGVTASCISCHNGVSASGKPVRHVQTTQDCGACHGTITWAAATFNHLGINATCQSCHNGVTATGKQVQHPSTTQDCGICHSTLNWTTTKPPVPLRPLLTRPRAATAGPAK
jgi:Cytochrome c7 and related cytochrome c